MNSAKSVPGPWEANIEDAPEYCQIEILHRGTPIAYVRNADDMEDDSRKVDEDFIDAEARDAVLEQLGIRGFGAHRITISTNLELRNDGLPRSGQRQPSDPGAAVYFFRAGKPCVLACDRWDTVEGNLYAVALHLEALRGTERWGVGTLEQTMRGYELPEPSAKAWWDVLGVSRDTPFETIRMAYRHLVKVHHPDRGGNSDYFLEIQRAWDEAQAAESLA